jgi:hypothetical protein
VQLRPVQQLVARPLSWLWPGRLALGKLALLEGDPGLGKSLLALDLCARLSTGRPWPDGTPGPGAANAIVLSGEDSAADTVRSRLEAAGADLGRIFMPDLEEDEADQPLSLPSQAALLDRALEKTEARLVVIDPLLEFLDPGVQVANEHSVRQALAPLRQLADRHRCTVLMHRHLNKSGGSHAAYRGGNSIAFLAVCRSGWLVAPDPQEPQRRVLAQVKNNLAAAQPSLAYELVGQAGAAPTVSWLGTTEWSADQLLAGAGDAPPRLSERERAREFLTAFLEDGPRTSQELWAAAQEQGLADRTLQRAKKELRISSVRVSVDGTPRSFWLLEGQEMPPANPPDGTPADLEPWLRPLRERFPPATPLDDL